MKKSAAFEIESWLHSIVHFIGVLVIYWFAIVPALWISLTAMIIQKLQMDMLGHCFLTNFAHKRGFMIGMTYWEYIAYRFGIKNHKQAGYYVDTFIKVTIMGILVLRIFLWILSVL